MWSNEMVELAVSAAMSIVAWWTVVGGLLIFKGITLDIEAEDSRE